MPPDRAIGRLLFFLPVCAAPTPADRHGVTVDGYKLLRDDEFRVGIYGVSLVLGYADNWLLRVMGLSQSTYRKQDKTLESLIQWGFSSLPEEVEIVNFFCSTILDTDRGCCKHPHCQSVVIYPDGGANNMGIIPEFLGGTPDVHYANVVFGGEVAIDGYQFPDGEIRYTKSGSAKLVGLDPRYISKTEENSPKVWKALQGFGFQGGSRRGKVVRKDRRGKSVVETISGSDLDAFVRFAAEHLKKPKAIALLGASFSEVRCDRERSAFNLAPKTTAENQRDFLLKYDRILIANARASLDDMGMDDNYNAPHASNWQGDNPDNDHPVYENPWD